MDIEADDVLRVLRACLGACSSEAANQEAKEALESAWRADGTAVACLSVRSGFDLLLSCVDWPRGSEVLMSAVNMPDMVRIVEAHGYVAVPVDVDVERMHPQVADVRDAITPATRALVVAHLFGARCDVEELAALARQHDLLLIEDCAQSFDGPGFTGHDGADASMFSFGTIKTATCMGGALLTVDDAALRAAMRARQAAYPLQSRGQYAAKVLKMLFFLGLQQPRMYGRFVAAIAALGLDHDLVIRRMSRGFGANDLLDAIRRRPCLPLIECMRRRLRSYSVERIDLRAQTAHRFCRQLSSAHPPLGHLATRHTYWVVPIRVSNRHEVRRALRQAGFDATVASSTLTVIDAPAGRPPPERALEAMDQLLYLPVYPEVSAEQLERMAHIINETARPPRAGQLVRRTSCVSTDTRR